MIFQSLFAPRVQAAALSLLLSAAALQPACAQPYPYQDPSLSPHERAVDLCGRLTLEEKASLMMNNSPAIPRLGIPQFAWWSEALHGVGRNGISTVFPSCVGMAASFDDQLIHRVFTAVSDEARAKNTVQRRQGTLTTYQGLSFWTPNINIFRDPRWGRGQETYGEDPFMNARMGAAVVSGLQGPASSPYRKLLACAKHYAVHSGPEKTRHQFNIELLPERDLWETYLPAFRHLVQQADVREVMCAYQRIDGDPCCGSDRLLQHILRDQWGFPGIVVSDCGAIDDFWEPGAHGVSADRASASALAVISGTDVECGGNYRRLPEAVSRGLITERQIDVSVVRLLEARFSLGDFDPDSLVSWTRIPESVVACDAHKRLALQMAREQMVLLHNRGNALPLAKDPAKIMVMGPNAADSLMLWGIYYGQPTHSVTVLEGIQHLLGAPVAYSKGCEITSPTESHSLFAHFRAPDGRPGLLARFWNNTQMAGAPDVETLYTHPLHFDNGGNTAFAPGVRLHDFTASFRGTFTAPSTETLYINYTNDDGFRLIIDGDTLVNRWKTDRLRYTSRRFTVRAGQRYDIQIDYMQLKGGATLTFDVASQRQVSPAELVARASDVETVIFVGGISPNLEREEAKVTEPGFDNGDRTSIELPACQRAILQALHAAGKRVVLVNCSGSAVALTPEVASCDAILQAWYPGEQGGHAVAEVLFGDYNPCGKLPVTFYADDSQLPPFDDYRMQGRTYRYFTGTPLFPFGHGLSYTSFALGTARYDAAQGCVAVPVTNTGSRAGTEVVQVYLRRPDDPAGPVKTLRGYTRVTLQPGETRQASIPLTADSFEWWDAATNTMRPLPGAFQLMVGTSSDSRALQTLTVHRTE